MIFGARHLPAISPVTRMLRLDPGHLRAYDEGKFDQGLWSRVPVTKYWDNSLRYRQLVFAKRAPNLSPGGIPGWYSNFDWVCGVKFGFAKNPRWAQSVFVAGHYLKIFMRNLDREISRGKTSLSSTAILVVGNSDLTPSDFSDSTLQIALQHFKKIYFYANDYSHPAIETYPLAITEHYLRGHEPEIEALLQNPPEKTNTLFVSWGSKWPGLNETISDRLEAQQYFSESSLGPVRVMDTSNYLASLAESKFMIYPRGNGIQSPKAFEALLFETIPVATRHPAIEDLRNRGMPILIVDNWHDVSLDLLNQAWPEYRLRAKEFHSATTDHSKWWKLWFSLAS